MENIKQRIEAIDWQNLSSSMHERGFALVQKLLTDAECDTLIAGYDNSDLYRKKVVMERYRFGLGEYKYFNYPLPDLLQTIRENVYPILSTIANKWMDVLKIDTRFPDNFADLQALCHAQNQTKPTLLILKYGKGGHNTLHQDLYGEVFFHAGSLVPKRTQRRLYGWRICIDAANSASTIKSHCFGSKKRRYVGLYN